jgi:hypothetical protein
MRERLKPRRAAELEDERSSCWPDVVPEPSACGGAGTDKSTTEFRESKFCRLHGEVNISSAALMPASLLDILMRFAGLCRSTEGLPVQMI